MRGSNGTRQRETRMKKNWKSALAVLVLVTLLLQSGAHVVSNVLDYDRDYAMADDDVEYEIEIDR